MPKKVKQNKQNKYRQSDWLTDWLMVWMFTKLYPSQHPTAPILCQPACVCSTCRGTSGEYCDWVSTMCRGREGAETRLWFGSLVPWLKSSCFCHFYKYKTNLINYWGNLELFVQIERNCFCLLVKDTTVEMFEVSFYYYYFFYIYTKM